MKLRLQDARLFAAELRIRAGTSATPDERDLFDAAEEVMHAKADRMEIEQKCALKHKSLSSYGANFCEVCGADLRNG